MMSPPITQLRALALEAGAAGDLAMVAIAKRAIAGSRRAARICARVIAAAAAAAAAR